MLNKRRSIPFLLALNITPFGVTLWSNVTNPNLYQYKLTRLVPHEIVNTLLSVVVIGGLLVATFAQPLLGLLSDRTRSPLGRRAPFLIGGAFGVCVALIAIAGAPSIAALFAAVLFGQVASNAIQGPWQALSPDSVPDSQKGASASFKTIAELAGVIISGIVISRLLANDQLALLVLILSIVSILTALLPVVTVPDRSMPDSSMPDNGRVDLAVTLRRINLREHRAMGWWLLNRFLFWAGLIAIRGFILGYLEDVGRYNESAAQALSGDFITLLGLGVLVVTLPAGLLSDRVGRTRIIALSSLVACVGALLLIFAHEADSLRIAAFLAGCGVGMYFSVNWALVTTLVPVQDAALFLGIANMATTLGFALGQLGGPLIDGINHVTGTFNGYYVLFGLAAVLFLLSAAAITRIDERPSGAAATVPVSPPER